MSYVLHPAAERDLASILDFYQENAGYVVAARFLEEFERVAELLLEHHDLGAPIARGRRVFPLRLFPYSVVYRNIETGILILVVRHQHRKPGYAERRA